MTTEQLAGVAAIDSIVAIPPGIVCAVYAFLNYHFPPSAEKAEPMAQAGTTEAIGAVSPRKTKLNRAAIGWAITALIFFGTPIFGIVHLYLVAQIPGPRGPQGIQGKQGPIGQQGPQGKDAEADPRIQQLSQTIAKLSEEQKDLSSKASAALVTRRLQLLESNMTKLADLKKRINSGRVIVESSMVGPAIRAPIELQTFMSDLSDAQSVLSMILRVCYPDMKQTFMRQPTEVDLAIPVKGDDAIQDEDLKRQFHRFFLMASAAQIAIDGGVQRMQREKADLKDRIANTPINP